MVYRPVLVVVKQAVFENLYQVFGLDCQVLTCRCTLEPSVVLILMSLLLADLLF